MSTLKLAVKRPYNWKVFFILWGLLVFASFAVLPYTLSILRLNPDPSTADIPTWTLLLGQLFEGVVLQGGLAALGLLLAARVGLGLPFVEGWLEDNPIWDQLLKVVLVAILIGVLGGITVLVLDSLVFSAGLTERIADIAASMEPGETIHPPAWQGFLASFYGGISEEVMLRLFFLTLLVWLGSLISRTEEGRPHRLTFWIANVLAAVLFGLAHLPATAAMGLPLDTFMIIRAVVLNGVLALAFGWLYWTRGLESAIVGHFSVDIVLHVIWPLIGRLLSQ